MGHFGTEKDPLTPQDQSSYKVNEIKMDYLFSSSLYVFSMVIS